MANYKDGQGHNDKYIILIPVDKSCLKECSCEISNI